jgi:integrase
MSRKQPPRLWLKPAERTRQAVWFVKDGDHRESTSCGERDLVGARQYLAKYLAKQDAAAANKGLRSPADIPVADVVSFYTTDVIDRWPDGRKKRETKARLKVILTFFGTKTLDEITGELCRDYVAFRNGKKVARRELEDLRAAINHHREEGKCNAVVSIVLPPKSPPRDRWLTRSEAAKLIWHAWRYREVQKGHPTGRYSRRHVARFLVAALYTSRRKSAVLATRLQPTVGAPWIDLENGVYYGRDNGSKKRQPGIRVPERLLAHLRRWKKNGQHWVVEFNSEPIESIDTAFTSTVEACGLRGGVMPHTTRHTCITWLSMNGVDPYEICRYAGITMEVFMNVYAHFHPDYMTGVHKGFRSKRGEPVANRLKGIEREQTGSNVTNIADFSRKAQ